MRQFIDQKAQSQSLLEDNSTKSIITSKQPHADTIASILGEASHLMHPLALWIQGYESILQDPQMGAASHPEKDLAQIITTSCIDAIHTLHKEAQTLAVTVGNWMLIDYGYIQDPLLHTSNKRFFDKDSLHNPETGYQDKPLNHFDSTLDEMAFACQIISRYGLFWNHITTLSNITNKLSDGEIYTHWQEVSLFYATSEIDLCKAKFSRALTMAMPIEIVLGKNTFVPSVVEDAYYISSRAVERASSTKCNRALSMVIHSICELWSVTPVSNDEDLSLLGAVYSALIQQVGCTEEHFCIAKESEQEKRSNPRGTQPMKTSSPDLTFVGGFATALLVALDTDEHATIRSNDAASSTSRALPKAPSSGSSWSRGTDLYQYHIDSKICLLNGIQAAFVACDGLETLLDSLSEEIMTWDSLDSHGNGKNNNSSMTDVSKKELQSHSKAYRQLLDHQIEELVLEYLGRVMDASSVPPFIASLPSSPPIHRLFYNVTHENYELDGDSFQKLDDEKRFDEEWIAPLRASRLVRELRSGKCDTQVHVCLAKVRMT
jgi:hypothetical protein